MLEPTPMTGRRARIRDVSRLNAFTDGVVVVSMTLLILNIELPESIAGLGGARLLHALAGLWPRYLAYILSFLVIGQYWLGYTRQFGSMRAADERFAEINILFLLVVGFMPFTTALVSRNGGAIATSVYAATMIAASLLLILLWLYAVRQGLVESREPPGRRWREISRSLEIVAVFAGSIAVAQYDGRLARWVWLLLAIPILPRSRPQAEG